MNSPHSERKHAKYSASTAYIWAGYPEVDGQPARPGCPMAPGLAAKLPESKGSPAAEEGTRAHEILQKCFEVGNLPLREVYLAKADDDQMRSGIRKVLEYVDKIRAERAEVEIYSELEILLTPICGGSFDVLIYCPISCQMWVIDFKYGKVPVNPIGNPQGLTYAVLAKKEFKKLVFAYTIVIIQPRDYNLPPGGNCVKEWVCGSDTIDRWEAQILDAIAKGESGADHYNPQADRCKYCHGAALCQALAPQLSELPAQVITPKAPRKKKGEEKQPAPPPFVATPEGAPIHRDRISPSVLAQVAEALDGLPAVEAYVAAVKKLANHLVFVQKLPLPNYKPVFTEERMAWDGDDATIATELWKGCGLSTGDTIRQSVISITDAKKLVQLRLDQGKGRDANGIITPYTPEEIAQVWQKFYGLTHKKRSGNMVLAPITDKRPSIYELDAAERDAALNAYANVVGAEEIGNG